MDWIGLIVSILLMLINQASPASVSSTTTSENEDLNTSSYQVTENIEDIPDDRSPPPVIPNFILARPLNFGNNTLVNTSNNAAIANNNNFENIDKNKEGSGIIETSDTDKKESSEETEGEDIKKVKKNSFSILHIKAEYDEKPIQSHGHGIKKIFGGIKEYVYGLKKGVFDGIHNYFHAGDHHKIPVKDFHDKFHRNFDGVADFAHDDSAEYFDHDSHEDDGDSKERSFEDYLQ